MRLPCVDLGVRFDRHRRQTGRIGGERRVGRVHGSDEVPLGQIHLGHSKLRRQEPGPLQSLLVLQLGRVEFPLGLIGPRQIVVHYRIVRLAAQERLQIRNGRLVLARVSGFQFQSCAQGERAAVLGIVLQHGLNRLARIRAAPGRDLDQGHLHAIVVGLGSAALVSVGKNGQRFVIVARAGIEVADLHTGPPASPSHAPAGTAARTRPGRGAAWPGTAPPPGSGNPATFGLFFNFSAMTLSASGSRLDCMYRTIRKS